MRRSIALLAVLLLATAALSAQIQVNTSHAGPVLALEYDAGRQHLISGGEDGKVKVWNLDSAGLRRSIQVSHLPVHTIAVHPGQPEIAVVHSDGRRRFSLSVWNWHENRMLFSHNLTEIPIFLDYSPQGNFLVYGQTDFNSLRFLSAQSGRTLPYMRRGFGIVTFATIASSEERIMTYTESDGSIIYWEIVSGRRVQSTATEPGIDKLTLLTNRRFAAGQLDNELVVVDILDGRIRDRYAINGIDRIMVNHANGDIAVLLRRGRQTDIAYFTFEGNRLYRRHRTSPAFPPSVSQVALHGESLHVASDDGSLYHYSVGSRPGRTLAENRIEPVTGIAVTNQTVHISTARAITSIDSDMFGLAEVALDRVQYLDVTSRPNPLRGRVGLSTILYGTAADQRIALWDTTGQNPVITSFDPATALFRELPLDEHRSLRSLHTAEDHLLLLHDNSSLRKVELQSFDTVFSYRTDGMETAVSIDEQTIVIGKSRLNPFDSSLLRIDSQTGETVRIDSDSFLVFDMAWDQSARLLYTLGLQQTATGVRTNLTVHRGTNLQNRRIIHSYEGEDLDARIELDPHSRRVYTSLGREGVVVWDGRRTTTLDAVQHVARDLRVAGRHLFAINRDGSVSVWNLRSGEPVMNVSLFTDGQWAVITAEGYYFVSSPQAERHLSFAPTSQRDARRRRLQDFRLVLPPRNQDDV